MTKNFLLGVIIFSISMPASTLTLKVKESRNLRELSNIYQVKETLKPNTIVKIPDHYVDAHFKGDKKDQVAVLKWLSDSKFLRPKEYKKAKNGKSRKNFFVPVIVKSTNKDGWISLRDLVLRGNLELVTTKETKLVTPMPKAKLPPIKNTAKTKPNQEHEGSEYVCTNPASKDGQKLFETLSLSTNELLQNIIAEIEAEAEKDIKNRQSHKNIMKRFNQTCKPYKFEDFFKQATVITAKHNIPLDLLLGLMSQESAGKCNRIFREHDGTHSTGLFQANSGTAKTEVCTKGSARASIKNVGNEKCLENPITNLKVGVKILVDKFDHINGRPPQYHGPTLINYPPTERDLWRKAIAAYNGGQAYVQSAWGDIQEFNRTYNTDLDTDNWEVRRAFMLRKVLEEQGQRFFTHKVDHKYPRDPDKTMLNLTYVESILSNENDPNAESQTSKWTNFVLRPEFQNKKAKKKR